MARIALVNAHWGALFSGRVRRYNRAFPPLDLLNVAAQLRNAGHHPTLYDGRVGDPSPREDSYDLAFVTLSPLDRWQCPNTDLPAMDRFLQPFAKDRTVLMGAQVTIRPEAILSRVGPLGALLGEPEASVVAVAAGGQPGQVPGTARWDGGALVSGPSAPTLDLTRMPMPAFDQLDFSRYRYEVLGDRLGLLELTRGCPWRCRFCLLTMYGKKYRKKSVDQVVAEIRFAQRCGMRCAYFQDLEMTADRPLVWELCDAMLRSGLKLRWACQTRPDTVDPELLAHMRRAGCELIHFGVESGAERVVTLTGKGQTLEQVAVAVSAARAVGMRTLCFFLVGLPTETLDEMWQTFAFAEKIRPTYASFQVATPYPTTPFHTEYAGGSDEPFPSEFQGDVAPDELRRLAKEFTLRYHLSPRYVAGRLTGPGLAAAGREAGLLARYAMTQIR